MIRRFLPESWSTQSALQRSTGDEFDPLTKLLSRAAFLDRLTNVVGSSDEDDAETALIVIDISEYHQINLAYGEEAGNRVLQQVADCIDSVRRDGDYLARIGDDQFSLLLTSVMGREHALLAANKLQKLSDNPFMLDGDEILLRLHMGVSLLENTADDPAQLFTRAVKAMYRSKNGGERIVVYDEVDQSPENHDGTLLLDFSKALQNNKLELKFQAKRELSNGKICGAEALLRWRHPTRGNIPPMRIIELAEKSGHGDSLSFWVLNQALRSCAGWLQMGMPMTVSVNLEARTFSNALLPAYIVEALELWRVAPRFLILEVTESTLMERNSRVPINIEELNRIGVRISIDDFGTGYSSLAYLNRLEVHELKIDKGFIDEMESSAKDKKLVTAIIELGRNFGLKVTAEGVETFRQLQKLRKLGCDTVQGYYVSPPLAIDEFIDFVSKELGIAD